MILEFINNAKNSKKKLLAMLVDPDKVENVSSLKQTIESNKPDLLLVGGSVLEKNNFDEVVTQLSGITNLPLVLFPGDASQISEDADGILLLSLISGRNPEYLIGQHVKAAKRLQQWKKEIIPTSYILIDGGNLTTVQKVSKTTPISPKNILEICNTAIAGMQMNHDLCYLEAGSGANTPVALEIINKVSQEIKTPIIVGGGIRTKKGIQDAWNAGATVVVIGTAFENNQLQLADIINA